MDDGCGLGEGGGVHDHIKTFYYHITCIVEYSYTSVTQSKTRCHEELDIERPNSVKVGRERGYNRTLVGKINSLISAKIIYVQPHSIAKGKYSSTKFTAF